MFGRLVKLTAQEPFAKLEERKTYRIRVVTDKRAPQPCYAIAAMRCENREELHWLSGGSATPVEAARLMRAGFELPANTVPLVREIVQALLISGQAMAVDTPCAAAA